MDETVKMSIDGRKTAITNAYDVPGDMKPKIEDLFKRIEDLGKGCKDSADFEAKFAASPLNAEYTQIFTDLAMSGAKCKFGPAPGEVETVDKGEVAKDIAKDMAEMEVDGAVSHVRGRAYRAVEKEARNMPVIGDAMDIQQKIGFGRHLFKTAKKDKDEE